MKTSHRRYLLVALGLAGTLGGWGLFANRPDDAVLAEQPVPAVAEASALGRIEPASRVRRVAPPDFLSNPRLDRLTIQEGSEVKAGDLLGWFAGHERAEASLHAAEAALDRAEAELARVKAGPKKGDLLAAEAREVRSAAQVAQARRDTNRSERLLSQNALAKSEAENDSTALEIALAEWQAAKQEYEATAEIREVDVKVAEAAVAEARAALSTARAEVVIQEIRAPISGTVLHVEVWPGEAADAKGVLELADLSSMHVVAEIYETDAAGIRVGQPAEVIVPGVANRLSATVAEVGWMIRKKDVQSTDPVADIDSRVVEVRLLLDAEGSRQVARMTNRQVQVVIAPAFSRS